MAPPESKPRHAWPPHCIGNTFDAIGCFADVGSVSPLYSGNRELTAGNNSAQIRITTGTSWPIIYDNFITNGALSGGNLLADGTPASAKTDMGIGVGSGESVDYPLCGKRGRVRPSDAKPENVLSFGSDLVDGDTFSYHETAYTYRAADDGKPVRDLAGLIALLDARTREECTDYGTGYAAGDVPTGHIRIRGYPSASADRTTSTQSTS